jgi:hypothetical protein
MESPEELRFFVRIQCKPCIINKLPTDQIWMDDVANSVADAKHVDLDIGRRSGERLFPLTKDRSKPSVPFAGSYRIVDFTLSNCINSGLRHIFVLNAI